MKKFSLLLTLVLLVSMFQSCKKEPTIEPSQEVAPQLPPPETFIMPFTGFEDADTTGIKGKHSMEEKNYGNWFYAAINLVVWNGIVHVGMALPVASFHEAFNHQPEHIGGGIYQWSYNVPIDGKVYIASLTGEFLNNFTEVRWTMTLSQVGGFTDVVWYTGIVSTDFKKASWTLYHHPNKVEEFLSIDYEYNESADAFFIRYTNIIPDHKDNGHYLEYRANLDDPFNRAYDVYRGSQEDFLEIQWNEPTSEGRVKNPAEFGDEEWRCWDGALMNTDC